jgi:hypothetical protein
MRVSFLERDEFCLLVAAAFGVLQDGADTADVELVINRSWLERCPFLGEQRVLCGDASDSVEEAGHLVVIFSVTFVELLAAGLPQTRMSRHVDARLRPANACGPRAFSARDSSANVELGGVFAEVPDVSPRVLAVPVDRTLAQPAAGSTMRSVGASERRSGKFLQLSLSETFVAGRRCALLGLSRRRSRVRVPSLPCFTPAFLPELEVGHSSPRCCCEVGERRLPADAAVADGLPLICPPPRKGRRFAPRFTTRGRPCNDRRNPSRSGVENGVGLLVWPCGQNSG